jgi:hypothetical protein
MLAMYLLALGSSSFAIPASSWDAWKRPRRTFGPFTFIDSATPLFTHQYSHAWFNFRGVHDKYADYFANSIVATKIHKLWCLELADRFPDYAEDLWGISASDSEHGYAVWGGPPTMGRIDGSVVPCATGGSLVFLPRECIRVLQNIREKFGKRAWKKYGFVDAFNPLTGWASLDVIGIDAGITALADQAERRLSEVTGLDSVTALPDLEAAAAAATGADRFPGLASGFAAAHPQTADLLDLGAVPEAVAAAAGFDCLSAPAGLIDLTPDTTGPGG